MSDIQVMKIEELINNGLSYESIGKELNIERKN
jgi:orotate phosphoribosyltransferase-like protein